MTGQPMLHGEGTIAVEIQFDGVTWIDVTADVMYDAKVNITQGRADETSQAQPAGCMFALLNTAGNYTPYDPRSIYYPDVSRNTPVRVRFDPGSGFLPLFQGYAVGFTPAWDTSAKKATVNVVAAGALRRLTQGKTPLRSPLYRSISTTGVGWYWPLEEGSGSTFANPTAGPVKLAPAGLQTSPTFGAAGPAGSVAAVDFSDGGGLTADIVGATTTAWTIQMAVKFSQRTDTYTPWLHVYTSGGIIVQFSVFDLAGVFGEQYDYCDTNTGTSIFGVGSGFGISPNGLNDGNWHLLTFSIQDPAGTVQSKSSIDNINVTSVSNSDTGIPMGSIRRLIFNPGWDATSLGRVCSQHFQLDHVSVVVDNFAMPATLANQANALIGYAGETVTDRIARLCAEEGVPMTITF